MKVQPFLKKLFQFFDLFSTTQFLRYKQQQDFKTVSGGAVSLLILSIFLALFFNTALQTINKSIINWTSANIFINQPPPTTLTLSNTSFMFTVGIMGLDLNDPNLRYFDIKMTAFHNGVGGTNIDYQEIALVPCSRQHFGIKAQLRDSFDEMPAKKWLCPPLNFSYQLYGKFISKDMKFIEISINQCNTTLNPSRPCIAQAIIDSMIVNYGPFMASFFYINPMINPGSADYLSYYMEAKNFVSFTKNLGAYGIGFVEDYTIQTDQSLLPFTENKVKSGVTVPELFQTVPYQVTDPKYASFNLMKSSLQTVYSRSFNKLDQFFSYVGGLVGTILGFMLFMGNFTSMAFELDLSQKLFKYNENEQTDFSKFSLFSYLGYVIYQLGRCFNCCKNWPQMKKKQICMSEIQKQLDISLILRRINFIEKIVSKQLGEDNYHGYHEEKRQILGVVRARRKLYSKKKTNKEQHQTEQNQHDQSSSQQSSSEQESQQHNDKTHRKEMNNRDDSFIVNEDYNHSRLEIQALNKPQSPQKQPKNNKVHNLHLQNNVSSKFLQISSIQHEQQLIEYYQQQNQIHPPKQLPTGRPTDININDWVA